MSAATYKRYYDEANGDKAAYDALVAEGNLGNCALVKGTALLYWQQYERENSRKECICSTGEELFNFLRSLPLSHLAFGISSTYSKGVETGYVVVVADPPSKTINLIGAADDI